MPSSSQIQFLAKAAIRRLEKDRNIGGDSYDTSYDTSYELENSYDGDDRGENFLDICQTTPPRPRAIRAATKSPNATVQNKINHGRQPLSNVDINNSVKTAKNVKEPLKPWNASRAMTAVPITRNIALRTLEKRKSFPSIQQLQQIQQQIQNSQKAAEAIDADVFAGTDVNADATSVVQGVSAGSQNAEETINLDFQANKEDSTVHELLEETDSSKENKSFPLSTDSLKTHEDISESSLLTTELLAQESKEEEVAEIMANDSKSDKQNAAIDADVTDNEDEDVDQDDISAILRKEYDLKLQQKDNQIKILQSKLLLASLASESDSPLHPALLPKTATLPTMNSNNFKNEINDTHNDDNAKDSQTVEYTTQLQFSINRKLKNEIENLTLQNSQLLQKTQTSQETITNLKQQLVDSSTKASTLHKQCQFHHQHSLTYKEIISNLKQTTMLLTGRVTHLEIVNHDKDMKIEELNDALRGAEVALERAAVMIGEDAL